MKKDQQSESIIGLLFAHTAIGITVNIGLRTFDWTLYLVDLIVYSWDS